MLTVVWVHQDAEPRTTEHEACRKPPQLRWEFEYQGVMEKYPTV